MAEFFGDAPPPDDLGIDSFHTLSNTYRLCPDSVRTPSIVTIARAFASNLDRPFQLATSLPIICFRSALRETWQSKARFSVFGNLDTEPTSEVQRAALLDALKTISSKWFESHAGTPAQSQELLNEAWPYGLWLLNEMATAEVQPNPIRNSITAILSSVLLGSWTAFEVLAGDLWVAALNDRPRLGFAALDADKSDSDSDEEKERKDKVKFTLPVKLLRKYKYDLKTRMGSVLRKKWDFARRVEAKEAYLKTFRKPSDKHVLESIFDDQKLIWMAAIRNSIVHDGAIADHEFTCQIKRHPQLRTVKEGESIPLRGSLVREFIDAASQRGLELIKFVDDWLVNNLE
jgi:hypothetical protein